MLFGAYFPQNHVSSISTLLHRFFRWIFSSSTEFLQGGTLFGSFTMRPILGFLPVASWIFQRWKRVRVLFVFCRCFFSWKKSPPPTFRCLECVVMCFFLGVCFFFFKKLVSEISRGPFFEWCLMCLLLNDQVFAGWLAPHLAEINCKVGPCTGL